MPISSQVPIIGYVANGVTKSFAFPFAILSADDLKVKVGADVVTTGFSIAGVGDRDGGSVTFTDAPASLTPIILYREVTLDRTTDYQENGDLLAIVLDDDLDRIWMALQDQLLLSDRALRSPIGETLQQLPPASERALMALAFDAAGNPIVVRGTNDGGAALALDLLDTEPGKGAALVLFKLTATSAAARTVLDKLIERVSVRDFGAKGDWNGATGTDDTAAFVACREHCRVTHAKLRIPSGRYRLTSAWIVGTNGIGPYDGFDIEGDGQECTELVLDFDGAVGVDINPGTGGYTAFANCAVGGFRVFVPPGRSVNVPLYIKNSYNARYHDLHVYAPLASVVSAFVGMRVSGACYFNQFENIWVEVYGGDSTAGKAYYIGNGRGDVGLAGANTSVNTFINCRTRGFGVGFDTVLANGTSFINCDAEVCTSAFRDLSANGSRYINCWQEGSANGLTVDRTTITNADGSTSMGSGSDYTIVDGGFWESIALGYAYRTRIKARYNSLTITANTEECDVDALSTSATYTGAGNDVRITKRLTTPIAHTVMSLGSRRYGYEFPNASGPAKLLYWNNGDDVVMGAYRLNTAGSYRGWTQATDGTGAWVLSSWFTSASIGSESPVQVLKANISGVAFNINPFGATDNAISCGTAGNRWSVVYAGTGTINTSDAREKQQIRELSEAERAVAVHLKSMIRAFKFNDAVMEKGDAARIHFGVIAQDVKAAFESENLVAESYAILCFDKWDAEFDADGNEIKAAGERYGVRYEELLAFIIAAL